MSARESAGNPRNALRTRARGVLTGLLAQLILGMAVNLLGLPGETTGAARIATSVSLILHVLIAVVLVVAAVLTALIAGRTEPRHPGLGWIGFAVIIVTFAAGVLTMMTNSGWLSFIMAAGTTASLVIYGILYGRARQGTAQMAPG